MEATKIPIRDFVVDEFVLVTGGKEIKNKENFIAWVRDFLEKINDFEFEVIESFQNENGTRVASLWRVKGKNNRILGTPPDQRPIAFTGTAIWDVDKYGKLVRNRVERASWEIFQQLKSDRTQGLRWHYGAYRIATDLACDKRMMFTGQIWPRC